MWERGEHIKLTPITEQDCYWIAEKLEDKEYRKGTFSEPLNAALPSCAVVIRLDDDTPVGWAELSHIDMINRKANFGISIPESKGRGLSFAVGRKMFDRAFNELGLNKIYMRIAVTNKAACKLAERFGFKLEGTERESAFVNGKFEDVAVYGLLKAEYEGG